MDISITCPHCGYKNPPHAEFCIRCGKRLIPTFEPTLQRQSSLHNLATIILILSLAVSLFLPWWSVKINAPLLSGELLSISPSGLKGAAAQLTEYLGEAFKESPQLEQLNSALHKFLIIAVTPLVLSAIALITGRKEVNLLSGLVGVAVFTLFTAALSSKLKEYGLSLYGGEVIEIMGFKLGKMSWGLKAGAYLYLLASIALIILVLVLRAGGKAKVEIDFSRNLSP